MTMVGLFVQKLLFSVYIKSLSSRVEMVRLHLENLEYEQPVTGSLTMVNRGSDCELNAAVELVSH